MEVVARLEAVNRAVIEIINRMRAHITETQARMETIESAGNLSAAPVAPGGSTLQRS